MAHIAKSILNLAAATGLAVFFHGAAAQVAPSVEVQRLAPQLVSFAGSPAKFESLGNGLAGGLPVILATANGSVQQTVTFTPAGRMGAIEVARTLEQARQNLISRGIGAPSAEQIGVSLLGGPLPTPLGPTTIAGVLGTPISSASAGASSVPAGNGLTISVGPAATSVNVPAGAVVPPMTTSASPQLRNTSESPLPRNTSASPASNTSASPTTPNTSATPAPASAGGPSPAVQLQNRR